MLTRVIPQLKDRDGTMHYIQDPMRAAVIMLRVHRQYGIRLNDGELHRLCTALCLPKLSKEGFVEYWTNFTQDVSPLKK